MWLYVFWFNIERGGNGRFRQGWIRVTQITRFKIHFERQTNQRGWMTHCGSGSPGRSHKRSVWKWVEWEFVSISGTLSFSLGITSIIKEIYDFCYIYLCIPEAYKFMQIFQGRKLFIPCGSLNFSQHTKGTIDWPLPSKALDALTEFPELWDFPGG